MSIVTEETARRIADALEGLEIAIANLKLPLGKAINPHYMRGPCVDCDCNYESGMMCLRLVPMAGGL